MDLSQEKIENAFARVISSNRGADPITLAEKLRERLQYLMEDAEGGFDIKPVRIVDDTAGADERTVREWDAKKPTPLREPAGVRPPPVPTGSLSWPPEKPS